MITKPTQRHCAQNETGPARAPAPSESRDEYTDAMGDARQPPHDDPAGEPAADPFSRAARELAANPDSPTSLRIVSALNAATRPRRAAVEQLVQALAEQLERSGVTADAAVAAAARHWEAVCQAPMTDELLQDFRHEAAQALERRRREPPPMQDIVAGVDARTDTGYELGVHLQGLRGTWHRLWAAIALGSAMGHSVEQRDAVAAVRAQLEAQLGRALTAGEWSRLEAHAAAHGESMAARLPPGGQ
jgi:hypothetical protein